MVISGYGHFVNLRRSSHDVLFAHLSQLQNIFIYKKKMLLCKLQHWLQGGSSGSDVALQQESAGFESRPVLFLHGVCMFYLYMHGFFAGTPPSSQSLKLCILA
ncbi:hypothetical protein CRENBAI_007640 [Crenichthys baileyi]|uniref:Uncharacterized protein n=1 Tax=Crenichthys baileyi TaxID=28760 RepID=A0AAV9SJF5_9TELE